MMDTPRLGIIVPYRDRAEHLAEFLDCVPRFFREDALNAGIKPRFLIVEQAPGLPFNRGAVLNAGYRELAGLVDYICLHDVDRMPLEADYRWPKAPTMIIRGGLPYADNAEMMKIMLGSVVLVQARQFETANGFSNTYWGWGYEDVDLRERLLRHGFVHAHRDGTFRSLGHLDLGSNADGSQSEISKKNQAVFVSRWFDRQGAGWARRRVILGEWLRDGLSTLACHTISPRKPIQHPAGKTFTIEHMTVELPPVGLAPEPAPKLAPKA